MHSVSNCTLEMLAASNMNQGAARSSSIRLCIELTDWHNWTGWVMLVLSTRHVGVECAVYCSNLCGSRGAAWIVFAVFFLLMF